MELNACAYQVDILSQHNHLAIAPFCLAWQRHCVSVWAWVPSKHMGEWIRSVGDKSSLCDMGGSRPAKLPP